MDHYEFHLWNMHQDRAMRSSTTRTQRWRSNNQSRHNEYMRSYQTTDISNMLSDPDELWFERNARKRKLLKQATPRWIDPYGIRRVYEQCVELNRKYPNTGFVVHHIVPISHSRVCGLHVPENLKIVSIKLKRFLGRKFNQVQSA